MPRKTAELFLDKPEAYELAIGLQSAAGGFGVLLVKSKSSQ